MAEEYTIPVGTVLYTGGFTSVSDDPTHYRFFTKNRETAQVFANVATNKVVTAFKVIAPIKIHLQDACNPKYYFDTPQGYSCEKAQALCQGGFHGYASRDPMRDIEDIGLCGVKEMLEKVTSGGRRSRTLRRKKRKTKKRRV